MFSLNTKRLHVRDILGLPRPSLYCLSILYIYYIISRNSVGGSIFSMLPFLFNLISLFEMISSIQKKSLEEKHFASSFSLNPSLEQTSPHPGPLSPYASPQAQQLW